MKPFSEHRHRQEKWKILNHRMEKKICQNKERKKHQPRSQLLPGNYPIKIKPWNYQDRQVSTSIQ